MVTLTPEAGLKRLKEKFRAEVGPGKQYWRARPATLTSPADRYRESPDDVSKEAGKAIYLSAADFDHLCLVLAMDETDSTARQYREYFELITYERRLRKDNPAVQAAWEQYQIMLTMARPSD